MGTSVFQDNSTHKMGSRQGMPAGHSVWALGTEETLQVSRNILAVSTEPSFNLRLQCYMCELCLSPEYKEGEGRNFIFTTVSPAPRWVPGIQLAQISTHKKDLLNEYINEWATDRFVNGHLAYRWFSCVTNPTPTAIPPPSHPSLQNWTWGLGYKNYESF